MRDDEYDPTDLGIRYFVPDEDTAEPDLPPATPEGIGAARAAFGFGRTAHSAAFLRECSCGAAALAWCLNRRGYVHPSR